MPLTFSPRLLHRGLLALSLLVGLPSLVAAQINEPTPRDRRSALGHYQVFHDFRYNDGGARSGALPTGSLVLGTDGSMYGTTDDTGGQKHRTDGSMYRVAPDGTVSTVMQFSAAIGAHPSGLARGHADALYGSLLDDGPLGGGTLYRLHPVEGFSIIHAFDCNDPVFGCRPRGRIVSLLDGSIVGATSNVTYKRAPDGTMTVLYPVPLGIELVGTDGKLYGTSSGNAAFRLSPQGQYTVLHTFDAASPEGTSTSSFIQGRDGNFYGTTQRGGALNAGTVYRMTPEGSVTVLRAFEGLDHRLSLHASDGYLYGGTTTNYVDYGGSIWRMALNGRGFRTVLEFSLEGGDALGVGSNLVESPSGTLVQAAHSGGRFNAGALIALTPRVAGVR